MKRRGVGIASIQYGIGNTGMVNPSSAFVEILPDGTVSLLCGASDMGQGSNTTLAQIVAGELGLTCDQIAVTTADTRCTPESGNSSASRQTYISGNACRLAAKQVKEVLLAEAADGHLDEPMEALRFAEGFISSERDPDKRVAISNVVASCRAKGQLVLGSGYYNPVTRALDPEMGQGVPYETYGFGTQLVEVEVDTDTGEITVLYVRAAHDVGKAINPQSVEGQIEGGVAMGLGYGLMEEVVVDKGVTLTDTFVDYMIPTALDIPPIEAILVEEPAVMGPFGAKGVGEPPACPTAAALLNAVHNATGIRITSLPVTAEKLYLAMQAAAAISISAQSSTQGATGIERTEIT